MNFNRGVSLSIVATLGGLLISAPPARCASVGLHQMAAHGVHESAVLPPLYGHVPAHVPQFTNHSLVNFWLKNEFSPVLRDPAIQMQLCMAVSQVRDVNPTRFDRNHPILGRLFRDPAFFNKVLDAYISHPTRFVSYHHHLIPLLRGCARMVENPVPPPVMTPGGSENSGMTGMNPVPEDI